jgi:hypothetical protein
MSTVVLGTEMVGSKVSESRMAALEGPKEFRLPASAVAKLKGITLGPGVLELLLTATPVAATLERVVDDVREADRALSWLEKEHPLWWPIGSIQDSELRRDTRMAMLVRAGSNAVSSARLAAQDLDAFLASVKGLGPGVAFDDEALFLYLQGVTDGAKRKRRENFKGTAAHSRLKGLKLAADILKAPYPVVALESRFTKAAVARPEAPATEVRAVHVSAAEIAALEDIALGEFYVMVRGQPIPVGQPKHKAAVNTARALVCASIASLRADDLRKARFDMVATDFALMLVDGPKPRNSQKRKLVSIKLPFKGSTPGVEMWAPGWAKGLVGRSFILEGFYAEKKYAGQVLHATALSGDLMPKEVVTPALRDLVGARLGISAKELKASALTGHAMRHYLTEVAVAGGWPDPMVDPLGRWASRANHVALKRSAAASYSAGVTSLTASLR